MKILKNNKLIKILIIVLLVMLLGIETFTFAKYVVEKVSDYFVSSKNFYFTSNILTKDNTRYEVNNWSGIGEFQISFDLSSKSNDYVYTDYDISYRTEVRCPSDVECSVDKPTGVIYQSTHKDTVTVTVSPTRLYTEGEKVRVVISARSTEPYQKNISATFEYIVGKLGTTYEVNDIKNRTYLLLNVTNAVNYCTVKEAFDSYNIGDTIDTTNYVKLSSSNKDKCVSRKVKVTFDPNVIFLDTVSEVLNKATYTNTNIDGVEYINKLEYYIGPTSTVDVKFYKKDKSKKYTYEELLDEGIMNVEISEIE